MRNSVNWVIALHNIAAIGLAPLADWDVTRLGRVPSLLDPGSQIHLAQKASSNHHTIQGNLKQGVIDRYPLRGVAGEPVVISVNSAKFSSIVKIQHDRKPSLLEIDIGRPAISHIPGQPALVAWTFPETGDYTITAEAMGGKAGAYRLDWTTGADAIALQQYLRKAEAALQAAKEQLQSVDLQALQTLEQAFIPYWGADHYLVIQLNTQQLEVKVNRLKQGGEAEAQQVFQLLQSGSVAEAAKLLTAIVQRIQTEATNPDKALADLDRYLSKLIWEQGSQYLSANNSLQMLLLEIERIRDSADNPETASISIEMQLDPLLTKPAASRLYFAPEQLAAVAQIIRQFKAESASPQQAIANLRNRLTELFETDLFDPLQSQQQKQQNWTRRARPFFENVLALYEASFGPDHPLTMTKREQLMAYSLAHGDVFRAQRLIESPGQAPNVSNLDASADSDSSELRRYKLRNVRMMGYMAVGNWEQAANLLRQEIATRNDPADQASLRILLASFLAAQGNYQSAIQISQGVVNQYKDLWQANPDADANGAALGVYAGALETLTGLYLVTGNYHLAEQAFAQSQQLQATLPKEKQPRYHQLLPNKIQADLYRRQGAYDQAEAIWRELLLYKSEERDSILNNLAEVSWAKGELPQAVEFRQQALIAEESQIATALSAASAAQSQEFLSQESLQLATSATISASLQASDYAPAIALGLTNVLQRKGRTLDLLAARQRYLQEQLSPADRDLLAELEKVRSQLASLLFQPIDSANAQRIEGRISNLQAEAARLEGELANRTSITADNLSAVTADAVQQKIPAQTALVEYVLYRPYDLNQPIAQALGAPRYAAYVMQSQGSVVAVDLGDAAKIDQLVADLRGQLQTSRTDLAAVRQAGRRLHQAVLEPLPVETTEHLLLAPDGQLNLIPFAALVEGNGRYLVETYRMTHLTSGRDLLKLSAPATNIQSVLIANPDYNQADLSKTELASRSLGLDLGRDFELHELKFGPLPGTAAEIEAIAPLVDRATVLTGTAATETALKQTRSPRILHIATHGFFLEDVSVPTGAPTGLAPTPRASIEIVQTAPNVLSSLGSVGFPPVDQPNPLLRSGLALAGFNSRKSGKDDGVLTALEASTLTLQGTQLVVLSACETGIGDVATGEGVYGLRRAFTLAGANSQLTSLWQVDDIATKDLMIDYYQRLIGREGRSEALRQTQLEMLQSPIYQHPYYWAAFVFSGDWKPLPE